MRPPRYRMLVAKSLDACLAAIEIYNKPNFQYREEAFAILMLNAWELLLKARIVQHEGGSLRSIEVRMTRFNKDGSKSKLEQRKFNRSGNAMTISLNRAAGLVQSYPANGIDTLCLKNLNLLQEIRDNAVHFYNISPGLGKRIQEVGSAALKNFVAAAERWFGVDMARYNFYLMPLSFHTPSEILESLRSEKQPIAVRRLLNHIETAERENPPDEDSIFSVTMEVKLKFVRTAEQDAIPVRLDHDDPSAMTVVISEDDIRIQFPWEYAELTRRLKKRYGDFLQNTKYHKIRKHLEENNKFCRVRFLDPSKPKTSSKKKFYSPNIVFQFDQHYTKK